MTVSELEADLVGALGAKEAEFAMVIFRRHLPRLLGDLEKMHQLREILSDTARYTLEVAKLRELVCG